MFSQRNLAVRARRRPPWNKGKVTGQKPPLKLREIWAIRIRLQIAKRARDLALFTVAIDSKLRACDLVRLRVRDVAHGDRALSRATVQQSKIGQPVRFELTEQTRESITAWIAAAKTLARRPTLPKAQQPICSFFDATVLSDCRWLGCDDRARTRRLRHALVAWDEGYADLPAHQEPTGGPASVGPPRKIESTVRYLGIEVDDVLEMAEQTEV
jgi:integrase